MGIIPPFNPIFYLFLFLACLLFVLTLIVLVRSKQARRLKALLFGCACCLLIVAIAYPMYLYNNKPAPLTSSSLLIGSGQNGQIVALNARDGSIRWTQSPGGFMAGGPGNVFYVASQTNAGGCVVTARMASNGAQVWHTLLPLQGYGKLQRLVAVDGYIYVDEAVGVSDETIYALRTSDGHLVWQHAEHIPDHLGGSLQPLLITAGNGQIFVRAKDSGFSVLQANDGLLAWHFSPNTSQDSSVYAAQLVLAEQNAYYLQTISGSQDVSLFALSQENGKILWQKRLQGSNAYANRLAGIGEHLYLYINGQTMLLNARTGAQFWQRPLISNLNITEGNGIAYISGNSAMNAMDERTGQVLWSLPADPDGDFTTPALSQNVLFASAQAIAPHVFSSGSGQDAVVAINPSNGSVYWSTANASNFIGPFHLP